MDKPAAQPDPTGQDAASRSPWPWLIAVGCLMVILLGILLPRSHQAPTSQTSSSNVAPRASVANAAALEHTRRPSRMSGSEPIPDAQEVVAGKVCRFAENRLGLVHTDRKSTRLNSSHL